MSLWCQIYLPNLHIRLLAFPSSFPNSFHVASSSFTSSWPCTSIPFSIPSSATWRNQARKQQAAAGPDLQNSSAISTYVFKYWSRKPNRRNLWAQVAALYWGVNSNLDVLGFSQNTCIWSFSDLYFVCHWNGPTSSKNKCEGTEKQAGSL